jgi:hypothetical protein
MKRLTVAGRLIITVLILGAIFVGYKYLGGQKALNQMAEDQAQSPQTEATTDTGETESTGDLKAGSFIEFSEATSIGYFSAFTYTLSCARRRKIERCGRTWELADFNSFHHYR